MAIPPMSAGGTRAHIPCSPLVLILSSHKPLVANIFLIAHVRKLRLIARQNFLFLRASALGGEPG